MEGRIQFLANYADWKAIKKIEITEKTTPKSVMEFLAGLTISFDSRIENNLRKIVELDELDKAIEALELGKKDVAKAIDEVKSRKLSSVIKKITEIEGLQKNEKKELVGFCKAYAMKKTLKQTGVIVDYSEIEIPGMKRLRKKKA